MAEKITKSMTIGEVIAKFPQTVEILIGKGMPCVGCHVAFHETLEHGLKAHGMSDKDIDATIKEMNEAVR
jgi:hybrid cluster-associated redox disulfide protein